MSKKLDALFAVCYPLFVYDSQIQIAWMKEGT